MCFAFVIIRSFCGLLLVENICTCTGTCFNYYKANSLRFSNLTSYIFEIIYIVFFIIPLINLFFFSEHCVCNEVVKSREWVM